MTKTIISLGVAVAVMGTASLGFAAEKASQKFLTKAIQGNYAEVAMGQMAQEKGASNDVKSFGQQLVKDHSDANQKATTAATSLGVPPPSEPNKKQKSDAAMMQKMSGEKFDRAFAKHMVMDHKKDIKDYEKASKMKGGDAASSYASETLPTLKNHLEMAQSLTKGAKTQ